MLKYKEKTGEDLILEAKKLGLSKEGWYTKDGNFREAALQVRVRDAKRARRETHFDLRSFVSALLGALLTFSGATGYYYFDRSQMGESIALQMRWEINENTSDTFNAVRSYNQEETFKRFNELNPESSIQESNFYYFTRHSLRDNFFKTKIGSLNLLKEEVMQDVLEFYSLLYSVDESEKQLENIFVNKVDAKVSDVIDISSSVAKNTKRMRTQGAQAVGKIMYYYKNYDIDFSKKDNPSLSTVRVLDELYDDVKAYVYKIESGSLIGAYDVASSTNMLNPAIYTCHSDLDMCALATAHYLILKTKKVQEGVTVNNGYIKK